LALLNYQQQTVNSLLNIEKKVIQFWPNFIGKSTESLNTLEVGRICQILRWIADYVLWISLEGMLINSLSVHVKGFQSSDVENLIQLWISLIVKGKNYDNFCKPQW